MTTCRGPLQYAVEDDGGLLYGPFEDAFDAHRWALGDNGCDTPFTIKVLYIPSDLKRKPIPE